MGSQNYCSEKIPYRNDYDWKAIQISNIIGHTKFDRIPKMMMLHFNQAYSLRTFMMASEREQLKKLKHKQMERKIRM